MHVVANLRAFGLVGFAHPTLLAAMKRADVAIIPAMILWAVSFALVTFHSNPGEHPSGWHKWALMTTTSTAVGQTSRLREHQLFQFLWTEPEHHVSAQSPAV